MCYRCGRGVQGGGGTASRIFFAKMDRLTDEVRQESPWTVMYADDIVVCSESREQVEEKLQRSWKGKELRLAVARQNTCE